MKTRLPVLVLSFRQSVPNAEALTALARGNWELRRVFLPTGNSYVHAVHRLKQTSTWDLPYLVQFMRTHGGTDILLINRAPSFVNQTGVTLETFLGLPTYTG